MQVNEVFIVLWLSFHVFNKIAKPKMYRDLLTTDNVAFKIDHYQSK